VKQQQLPLSGVQRATLRDVERDHVLRVLVLTENNKSEAARVLGIDRRTLHRKLQRYAEAA
jgi:two-component system, NtrC family, response regulator HydG